ncbi:MAG: hypothetical protein GEU96_19385 [Propionibacteriales bacterium]|nr:hypothetical protein [Propionibacteriales bacterium]
MKHTPLAVYAPEVNKTFFTYGGTLAADSKHLLNMASYYDHATHTVPRPTVVHDKGKDGVIDPHDNASIQIADDGHLWIFVSGRARARPGFKYRSVEPYSVDEFEQVTTEEMTYPQPTYLEGQGFIHLFTKYTQGRELYWETSDATGRNWSEDQKLVGFGGHYQSSAERNGLVATVFNYHPGGNVDRRTNLYFLQSADGGETWRTADGAVVETPLSTVDNPAMVVDYAAQGRLVYLKEVTFDQHGSPVILYVTSGDHRPGPAGDPRTWHVAHWGDSGWQVHDITSSDHNYDSGSLYVDGDEWTVVAPTDPGPQPYQTGGEMVQWKSTDDGVTWTRAAQVTDNSDYNHTYARRPLDVNDPFYVFWADGDPTEFSPSRLYFGDSTGDRYWRLPDQMDEDVARPVSMFDDPCDPPDANPTVVMGDVDSDVPNRHAEAGCTVDDLIRDEDSWNSKGPFMVHVQDVSARLTTRGVISSQERAAIISAAARSSIGD